MESVENLDKLYCIIFRDSDWSEGLHFITPDSWFIQVGTWQYEQGKKLDAHMHKLYERITNKTHEVVYVRKGSLRVDIFDLKKSKVRDVVLNEGDMAIFADGGHSYEILENDTQVLEVKNGPFISVNKDKVKFEPH